MSISKFISRLTWVYVIFFCLWILLRFRFFDSLWWLALINSLTLYVFVPLFLFLPFALLFRKWRLLVGLCFPLGIFIGLYISFFLPSLSTPVSQNQQTIKAMTFNMLRSNTNYDSIVKMVSENNPDIIGLQDNVESLKQEISPLKEGIANSKNQIQSVKEDIAPLKEEITNTTTQIESLQQEVAPLQEKTANITSQIESLNQRAESLKEDIVSNSSQIEFSNQEIAKKSTQIQSFRQELASLKQEISEAKWVISLRYQV